MVEIRFPAILDEEIHEVHVKLRGHVRTCVLKLIGLTYSSDRTCAGLFDGVMETAAARLQERS